ncbi:MAG: hypothetical protein WC028_25925 [Candidatus Obscuribacterales bacterium]
MKKSKVRSIASRIALALLMLPSFASFALAQGQFSVGQKVMYKPNQFQEIWEEGTVTKVLPETTPGLHQVVIRSTKPNPYNLAMHDEVSYETKFVKPAGGEVPEGGTMLGGGAEAARPGTQAGHRESDYGFKVGQKVQFKTNQFQDNWEEGIVTKIIPQSTPGLKQVLIRSLKPSPYNPAMFDEVAYSTEHVRAAGTANQQALAQQHQQASKQAQQWQQPQGLNAPGKAPNLPGQPQAAGGGNVADLFGKWSTLQVGHNVDTLTADGKYIVRQLEIGAKNGDLIIKPDHTYTWLSVSEGPIKGMWRDATPDEARSGWGGPSIRLLHAEGGWDYTVSKRPQQPGGGNSITLGTNGYQVNAYR